MFGAFSVSGWLIFGNVDGHFSSIAGSFNMVYKMALGEIDLMAMMGLANLGALFYYTHTLLIVFIMINVFLAIIMDSYAKAVEETEVCRHPSLKCTQCITGVSYREDVLNGFIGF